MPLVQDDHDDARDFFESGDDRDFEFDVAPSSAFFLAACIRVVTVHMGMVHMTLTHPAADAMARLDKGPGFVRFFAM